MAELFRKDIYTVQEPTLTFEFGPGNHIVIIDIHTTTSTGSAQRYAASRPTSIIVSAPVGINNPKDLSYQDTASTYAPIEPPSLTLKGRSKRHPYTAQQAMHDHHKIARPDIQDWIASVDESSDSRTTSNNGYSISRHPGMPGPRATSFDGTALPRPPTLRSTQTMSSTDSKDGVRFQITRPYATSSMHGESAEVGAGEFSKPQIRRHRPSHESSKSQKEFQYYGRHANSWLFNDFSVKDTVKKGWGKVFSKGDGGR